MSKYFLSFLFLVVWSTACGGGASFLSSNNDETNPFDRDGDGLIDSCDSDPTDPNKKEKIEGCFVGAPEDEVNGPDAQIDRVLSDFGDFDKDGVKNIFEVSPENSAITKIKPEYDKDKDGLVDVTCHEALGKKSSDRLYAYDYRIAGVNCDNCLNIFNPNRENLDVDYDGLGDVCDRVNNLLPGSGGDESVVEAPEEERVFGYQPDLGAVYLNSAIDGRGGSGAKQTPAGREALSDLIDNPDVIEIRIIGNGNFRGHYTVSVPNNEPLTYKRIVGGFRCDRPLNNDGGCDSNFTEVQRVNEDGTINRDELPTFTAIQPSPVFTINKGAVLKGLNIISQSSAPAIQLNKGSRIEKNYIETSSYVTQFNGNFEDAPRTRAIQINVKQLAGSFDIEANQIEVGTDQEHQCANNSPAAHKLYGVYVHYENPRYYASYSLSRNLINLGPSLYESAFFKAVNNNSERSRSSALFRSNQFNQLCSAQRSYAIFTRGIILNIDKNKIDIGHSTNTMSFQHIHALEIFGQREAQSKIHNNLIKANTAGSNSVTNIEMISATNASLEVLHNTFAYNISRENATSSVLKLKALSNYNPEPLNEIFEPSVVVNNMFLKLSGAPGDHTIHPNHTFVDVPSDHLGKNLTIGALLNNIYTFNAGFHKLAGNYVVEFFGLGAGGGPSNFLVDRHTDVVNAQTFKPIPGNFTVSGSHRDYRVGLDVDAEIRPLESWSIGCFEADPVIQDGVLVGDDF